MTVEGDERIKAAVRTMRDALADSGWVVVNSLGEQSTPDHRLWFVTVFTSGEYTVEASYRPKGFGKAEGVTRVRITPTLLRDRPALPDVLANELIDKAAEIADGTSILDVSWPPPHWLEFTR